MTITDEQAERYARVGYGAACASEQNPGLVPGYDRTPAATRAWIGTIANAVAEARDADIVPALAEGAVQAIRALGHDYLAASGQRDTLRAETERLQAALADQAARLATLTAAAEGARAALVEARRIFGKASGDSAEIGWQVADDALSALTAALTPESHQGPGAAILTAEGVGGDRSRGSE